MCNFSSFSQPALVPFVLLAGINAWVRKVLAPSYTNNVTAEAGATLNALVKHPL